MFEMHQVSNNDRFDGSQIPVTAGGCELRIFCMQSSYLTHQAAQWVRQFKCSCGQWNSLPRISRFINLKQNQNLVGFSLLHNLAFFLSFECVIVGTVLHQQNQKPAREMFTGGLEWEEVIFKGLYRDRQNCFE